MLVPLRGAENRCCRRGRWGTLCPKETSAAAFQAPINFPLLWVAKRLTTNNVRGVRRPVVGGAGGRGGGGLASPAPFSIPLMAPLSGIKGLVVSPMRKKDGTDRLVEWLGGGDGRGSFSSSVKVDTSDVGLRGLYATRDVRKGEILLEIPYGAALLVGDWLWVDGARDGFLGDVDAGSEGLYSEEAVDDVHQGLNFLRNFARGGGSGSERYSPYVRVVGRRRLGVDARLLERRVRFGP